jgi:hypothetical protein
VPRSGVNRLIAAMTAALSVTGAWTELPLSLNATTPIWTVGGWRSMNERAAALAASMRVGVKSVAAMLPDTSNARMTVPSKRGTLTAAWGRASATTPIASPTNTSAGATCDRLPTDVAVDICPNPP